MSGKPRPTTPAIADRVAGSVAASTESPAPSDTPTRIGRSRLPAVGPVLPYGEWLRGLPATADEARFVLSLADGALPVCEALKPALHSARGLLLLSGPEGGLGAAEDTAARAAGLQPVTLGPRVLRAETAPLAVLGALTALFA